MDKRYVIKKYKDSIVVNETKGAVTVAGAITEAAIGLGALWAVFKILGPFLLL